VIAALLFMAGNAPERDEAPAGQPWGPPPLASSPEIPPARHGPASTLAPGYTLPAAVTGNRYSYINLPNISPRCIGITPYSSRLSNGEYLW